MSDTQRPTLLTLCCILSFIAGIFRIGFFTFVIFIASAVSAETSTQLLTGAALLLTFASLFGVIQMWNLQKTGFYIYSAASVLSLILLSVSSGEFPVLTVIFGLVFIGLFALNLKDMK